MTRETGKLLGRQTAKMESRINFFYGPKNKGVNFQQNKKKV